MGPDHKTVEWSQFRPEQIPEAFSSYWPVCWDFHILQTFRRDHPELCVYRNR